VSFRRYKLWINYSFFTFIIIKAITETAEETENSVPYIKCIFTINQKAVDNILLDQMFKTCSSEPAEDCCPERG